MQFTIEPIVTEAATKLTDKLNRYTFRVSPDANKFQIKDMVEKIYGVKVEKHPGCPRQKQGPLHQERPPARQNQRMEKGLHHSS